MGRGAWSVERGAWSVERGAWGVGRGAWSVERGAWSVGRGAWSVERGAWGVGHGTLLTRFTLHVSRFTFPHPYLVQGATDGFGQIEPGIGLLQEGRAAAVKEVRIGVLHVIAAGENDLKPGMVVP